MSDCLASNWTTGGDDVEDGEDEDACGLVRLLQALVLTGRRRELFGRPNEVCAGYAASLVPAGALGAREEPSLRGFQRFAKNQLRSWGKVRKTY